MQELKRISQSINKTLQNSVISKKSNTIKVLNSIASTDSNINCNDSFSVNNVLKEYDNLKEEITNLKTSTVHQRF